MILRPQPDALVSATGNAPLPGAPTVWQETDGWHVRVHHDGAVKVFKTRDEAISYSTSTFTDGATSARAETQRGDVVPTAHPAAQLPNVPPSVI